VLIKLPSIAKREDTKRYDRSGNTFNGESFQLAKIGKEFYGRHEKIHIKFGKRFLKNNLLVAF
jgi:hypothetical protein